MNVKTTVLGMGLALVFAGCASTPRPNAALESARIAVQAAQADPNVGKYAALDLEAAKKQLEIAEMAATHHEDAAVAEPAYLAAQTAHLAQARASAKADDARVAAGQAERDKIQLAARTRDVDNAKTATNAALGQRDQATEQSARLQAEVDQLKATPTPRGLVLTLGDVLFDTGKAKLNSGSSRKLDQLAQFLTEHPERRVQVDGFTDSVGSDSYNLELSQQRADAVKSSLISRGIDPSRIGSQGYGKGFPVANNVDSGGRQLNRRVEVVIGGDNGASIAPRGV
ncbi:MAG TPA: OmpA family protein [Steroidobacteraceae bacterium]|nr:OmpA family protein [Steroidobacteraceae bacterium]